MNDLPSGIDYEPFLNAGQLASIEQRPPPRPSRIDQSIVADCRLKMRYPWKFHCRKGKGRLSDEPVVSISCGTPFRPQGMAREYVL